MKAEELRIGNWVQFRHTETPVLITLGDFVREYKEEHFEDYEPIPLTYEWLTRFGFECISKDRNWHDVRLNRRLNISLNVKTGAVAFSFFGNDWVTMDNYTISYVHQLQNLCHALKGEELTIKQ